MKTFIQWKNTDLCMDFWCECGQQSHYDGTFAYAIACPGCGLDWVMPQDVAELMHYATEDEGDMEPLQANVY